MLNKCLAKRLARSHTCLARASASQTAQQPVNAPVVKQPPQQRTQQRNETSRRDLLLTSIAGAILASFIEPFPCFAEVDTAKAVDEYTQNLAKFSKDLKALEKFRERYGFKRSLDGRVMLRSRKGEWYQVRLDMELPGTMLLRDSKKNIYGLQIGLKQVDLSDDMVILFLFADGKWEENMVPVQFEDDNGKTQQLQLEEQEFREIVGFLKEWQEENEEAEGNK